MAEKFLGRTRGLIRAKHYSYRNEQAYLRWAERFILFQGKRHPPEMGKHEMEAFLADLSVQRQVAAATLNYALNGILYLVLG